MLYFWSDFDAGPGCSSAMGLLMELGELWTNCMRIIIFNIMFKGPCSIDMSKKSENGTVWNPYGWNEAANIFFLDQP
jgi:carboxypeptidase C (cathepsin A)